MKNLIIICISLLTITSCNSYENENLEDLSNNLGQSIQDLDQSAGPENKSSIIDSISSQENIELNTEIKSVNEKEEEEFVDDEIIN